MLALLCALAVVRDPEVEVEVGVVVDRRWARGSMIECVTTSAAHRMADRLLASREGILEYMIVVRKRKKNKGEREDKLVERKEGEGKTKEQKDMLTSKYTDSLSYVMRIQNSED
jgi:hypothetical protein